MASLKDFANEFADLQRPDDIYSSHALDLLADVYAEEGNSREQAIKALDLLADKYDPIRVQYWNYRKEQLGQTEGATAAA